ncbi:MAG: CHASE domain-containing protein [Flavobacteriales bacterium]|nr:CHASE domain-containing protein [Flavobacteriales bacterium]
MTNQNTESNFDINTSGTSIKLSLKQLLSLAVTLAIGITITCVIYNILSQKDKETQFLHFESTSKDLTAAIEKEITSNLEALISINSLYSVTDSVSRTQFKEFNYSILKGTKSIQALEWIPLVKEKDKYFYESMAHNDGLIQFQITEKISGKMAPVNSRKEYYPVFYVEPLIGNEKALGFDLASNPTRLAALHKAIKTNDLVTTSRITLVQEKEQQKGILVFCPIKKQGEFIGFSLGVYRIKGLISQAIGKLTSEECNITLFDLSAEEGNQLLAQLNENNSALLPDTARFYTPNGISYQEVINVADRKWLILITPTQIYINSHSRSSNLILIICIILSFVISYYLFRIFRTINKRKLYKEILESKIRDRTKDLSDYKTALDASSIVAITDTKGDIISVNDTFCEISKYSEKELIGQNQRIVNSGFHPKEFWKEMWVTIGKGKIWKGEIKNKAKDGSYYWVATTIIPFIGKNNKPYQYLAIRTDITQQKSAEQKLLHSIISSQEETLDNASEALHEGLAQQLAGLNFHIKAIESSIEASQDDDLKDSFSLIKKYVLESIKTTRSISSDLIPRSLTDKGLVPAINQYILEIKNKISFEIEFKNNLEKVIEKDIEITIYRAVELFLKTTQEIKGITKIFIELTDTPSLQVNFKFSGNPSLFLIKKNEIKAIQKRIELLEGKIVIHQNSTKKSTIISITF